MPNSQQPQVVLTEANLKAFQQYYLSIIRNQHVVSAPMTKEEYVKKKLKKSFPLSMQEYVKCHIKFYREYWEKNEMPYGDAEAGAICQRLRNYESRVAHLRSEYQDIYLMAYKICKEKYEKRWDNFYTKGVSTVDSKSQAETVKNQKLEAEKVPEKVGASLSAAAKPAINQPSIINTASKPTLKELSTDDCPDKVKATKDKEGESTENEFQPGLPNKKS